MPAPLTILLLAPADPGLIAVLPYALIAVIFWVVLFQPVRQKQKKLEEMIKTLKPGDKVIVSPGIFATIVGVEDDAFQVRIDEKTRIKILKSAVAGLQGQPLQPMENK